jgi:hypothetical protein
VGGGDPGAMKAVVQVARHLHNHLRPHHAPPLPPPPQLLASIVHSSVEWVPNHGGVVADGRRCAAWLRTWYNNFLRANFNISADEATADAAPPPP